ncbi:Uncharacterized protein YuzE [Streptomyces sp. DvalAA-14]|uniref:DUF2283 domain-containing protein n=1 Tax=unclassified Streptomyces TaxID=2593676 RepID=UPI00081B323E|nr:DUF2283 domain-containing protein [Streptomyces sp. DvalAA-14]SCD77839.1 Uncharacterized protein YuzE [Streptomyces sp. DvalAA-14]
MADVRVTYDKTANAAYIYLTDPQVSVRSAHTHPCDPIDVDGMINLDFDELGRLIGIEVLAATSKLPEYVLKAAERLDSEGSSAREQPGKCSPAQPPAQVEKGSLHRCAWCGCGAGEASAGRSSAGSLRTPGPGSHGLRVGGALSRVRPRQPFGASNVFTAVLKASCPG